MNELGLLLLNKALVSEAEPLLRRALDIDEKSFGTEHPNIVVTLNNLAMVLLETSRPIEAEPMLRRALTIVLEFEHRTGHEHPHRGAFSENYRALLKELGKPDAEIEAAIEALVRSAGMTRSS